MNIAVYIDRSVKHFPERVALRLNDGQGITYLEMSRRADGIANYLRLNGFKKGDRLGVYMPNCPDYTIALYATWKLGGIAIPINYRFREKELQFVIQDSEIDWLVTTANDFQKMKELFDKNSVHVISQTAVEGAISLDHLYEKNNDAFATEPCFDDEPALIMYTSGSTGRPKGVVQTHRTNTASVQSVIHTWDITNQDHGLVNVPLFHVGGLQCITLPVLFVGGTVTYLQKWDAKVWVALSEKIKPTVTGLASTMIVDVVNFIKSNPIDKASFQSYRFVAYGGSPTPDPVLDFLENNLGVKLLELYGQTELSGLMVTYSAEERRRKGSMGKLLEQIVEGKVVTPNGREVRPGEDESGELMIRGDVVTPGYLNLDDLNRERFQDGWIKTGDVVRWDKDGYLYYVDRIDDMIVTGGENVYPKEVENILAEHPKIKELAVIGTPHERWIEQVTAVIVPLESSLTEDEVIAFCKNHPALADYKRPRKVIFEESLPRTASGKINKSLLKQKHSKIKSI